MKSVDHGSHARAIQISGAPGKHTASSLDLHLFVRGTLSYNLVLPSDLKCVSL